MERLAPNVCVLIGATLAARMVALAGGMAELSRIPACNLQVLGQTRATAASRAGLSTAIAAHQGRNPFRGTTSSNSNYAFGASTSSKPHEGMIAECELYQKVPHHLQRKALKVICAKLALAIRCDYVNLNRGTGGSGDGDGNGNGGGNGNSNSRAESGRKFRQEIENKFAKLIEPDIAPVIKALPK